jgi:lipopolysaccharide assembly outer membrane protein LptD (OstA)
MTARPGARGGVVAVLSAVLLGCRLACAAEPMPAEVRVVSTPPPQPTTSVVVRARPDTVIEDRTVGAKPSTAEQGPASTGETFQNEITVFLRDFQVSKPTAVEIADPVVSTVRVLPEATGTTVVVFIRQPVTYTVSRPSGIGDVVISLRTRKPAPSAAPAIGPTGRMRAPNVGAGQRGKEEPTQELQIDAEELTYDQESDTTIARGSVTITRGYVTLQADEVRYHRLTGLAEATGHVVISDPEAEVTGESASMDMNDESGWMEHVDGTFSSTGYHLHATKMTKGVGPSYHIEDSLFTTCHCGGIERPSWSIGGQQTNIRLTGFGVVHGATIRVKDVPVFWLPILGFPANQDRQTGFLIPRFSYSNRRGFGYEQPFFWAINKSMDATIAPNIETAARLGVLGEYRYTLGDDFHGAFGGGYWNETIRSSKADEVLSSQGVVTEPPFNRYLIVGQHRSSAWWDSSFYLDAFKVSDTSLLKNISAFDTSSIASDVRLDRSTTYTTNDAGLIKTWNGGLVQGEADYYQDLIDPQELVTQRAPFARAQQTVPFLNNLILGGLSGQATDYQRDQGFDGLRGDLSPNLFVPFNVGRYLHGSLGGELHGTLYELADQRQVAIVVPNDTNDATTFRATKGLPLLDASHTRGVPVVRGVLGTDISRVFDFKHFGLEKIRHSIEPELRYLYVPSTEDQFFQKTLPNSLPDDPGCPACLAFDKHGNCIRSNPNFGVYCKGTLFGRGYLFDGLDAIEHRNFFSYGITSRILGRGAVASDNPPPPDPNFVGPPAPSTIPAATPATELLRGSITSGWDVSREISPPSHFANVDLGLRFTPVDYVGLSYAGSLEPISGKLAAQTYAMVLKEPHYVPPPHNVFQSPTTVGVSYRFVGENVNELGIPPGTPQARLFANGGLQETDAYVYLRLGDFAGFTFVSRYDLNGGELVKQNGRLEPVGPHFIERDYLFRLISRCNCWAAEFGVSQRFDTQETLYRFQITLLGLGSFGQSPGGAYVGFAPLQALGLRRPPALGGSYF